MGRSALPPRRRAAAAALVTVSLVLTGTAALPAAPAAAATALPPWTGPATLSTERSYAQEVVVTSNGTAVALWSESVADNTPRTLYTAVRAAGGDTWSARAVLATDVGEVRAVARTDGSVAALWTEGRTSSTTGAVRLVAAVLSAGPSPVWSPPAELVGTAQNLEVDELDLAAGPGGAVAAVWRSSVPRAYAGEAYAATLGADGSWTAPVKVSNASAYGGPSTKPQIARPQIVTDAQGGLVVAYWMNAGGIVKLMTTARPAGAEAWQTPQPLADGVRRPALAAGPDGSAHLVWQARDGGAFQYVRRADASHEWSLPQSTGSDVGEPTWDAPEPLAAPDGDVTLVWPDSASATKGVRTTTLDTSSGLWSPPRNLSTTYVGRTYDTSVAPDGSVHVLWTQNLSSQYEGLLQATLADGTWSDARRVGGSYQTVDGLITARSATDVTALWDWSYDTGSHGVQASRTAWPKLAVTAASVPQSVNLRTGGWAPTWQTNTAVTSWTLTLTDGAGRTVRSLTGAPGSTSVAASWNGRTTSGALAPNGRLNWTLKAVQSGSGTTSTLATGTVTVSGGAAVHRDFGGRDRTPDGVGDVLLLTSAGRFHFAQGTGGGGFELGDVGTGWPTTAKAVPFGDLSGDRCNDVLVRLGDALRLSKPACGAPLASATPYKTLFTTGWKQYDVLTSPGDITKDGRPDLITRNAATGAVYLHKGTSTGTLAARVKLYGDWRSYKKVVGVGDLNGDGIGDLLAQDKGNNLYRYLGTGSGTFTARVRLFTDWGGTYNTVIGAGDINRDGRADLVARDSGGYLYRQYGTGTGTFGARALISKGWGTYIALS
ncbi:FG-GAP-like repeat-containing protein [Streptomyces sp. A012304]|uniref:FG-GAP-like repeat-containing protein n=1 Tax=Streptomyces sp. A012304 TaxID=375446 RepID=UPI00222F6592|nr:FG-GAP-like repeat-containing protein [Streptomyces sp. A012304]GKQ35770.1 hypothetical protein ALMP_23130 [Streptomyces sp. A012304]